MYQFFNFLKHHPHPTTSKNKQSPCWSYPLLLVLDTAPGQKFGACRTHSVGPGGLVRHVMSCAMVKSQDMHWEIGNKNYGVAPTHYRSMMATDKGGKFVIYLFLFYPVYSHCTCWSNLELWFRVPNKKHFMYLEM